MPLFSPQIIAAAVMVIDNALYCTKAEDRCRARAAVFLNKLGIGASVPAAPTRAALPLFLTGRSRSGPRTRGAPGAPCSRRSQRCRPAPLRAYSGAAEGPGPALGTSRGSRRTPALPGAEPSWRT